MLARTLKGTIWCVAWHLGYLLNVLLLLGGQCNVAAQIAYTRHLSSLRIEELKVLARRVHDSVNADRYACESFYDHVCSRNRPLFSILGSQPETAALMALFKELQDDSEHFEAKRKLLDFFISCSSARSIDDCYRESFEHFKPIFGFIIAKKHIDASSHEHRVFLELLERFVNKVELVENYHRNPARLRLATLKEKFRTPHIFFRHRDLDREYHNVTIYRDGYPHNRQNLAEFRRRNSSYEAGVQRTMLDWTLYLYQSLNKPMSYYFPTLNVHLWMAMYNYTVRYSDVKRANEIAECLKLPQFVNVLEEARILAVVYLKSFQNAWQDYREWITASQVNRETFDHENEILKVFNLDNKRLFFVLYAQAFCDFGKELAENVFYLGIKQNQDFFNVYDCGYQTESGYDCV